MAPTTKGPASSAQTKQPMQLIRNRTAITGTQSDPWKPYKKAVTGRLPGRSACRCAALPKAV